MEREEELNKKAIAYRILESRLQGLIRQRDLIANKILEISSTLESIEEIGKSDRKILVSLGAEAYAFGEIKEKNRLIVEIGAGIALEKTFNEAKEMLKRREEELKKNMEKIQKNIIEVNSSLEELAIDISKLSQGK